MRMPDRLKYEFIVDSSASGIACPPMTLLTLVENAVRHGIDPSEIGGLIKVEVRLKSGYCTARISDTGVGLKAMGHGLGTGIASLRERLQLAFAGQAELRLLDIEPHGVLAEVVFPVRAEPA